MNKTVKSNLYKLDSSYFKETIVIKILIVKGISTVKINKKYIKYNYYVKMVLNSFYFIVLLNYNSY